jgi:dihydrofolate reductase
MIRLIVAHDRERGIGRDNELMWKLPNDMAHFRRHTMGNVVVMGRKTYESIGGGLKGRTNIVLSRTLPLIQEGDVYVERHFQPTLKRIKESPRDVYIIGGAEIYRQFLPHADEVIVTEVDGFFGADAFFPALSPYLWELYATETGKTDDKNKFTHHFLYFRNKRNLLP